MKKKFCKFSPKDLPQLESLAELYLIQNDLQQVLSTLTRCLDAMKSDVNHGLITDFYISGLITYARCFNSGKRSERLTESIYDNLGNEAKAAHQTYMNTRSKHIAHPVNAFEEIEIAFSLSENNTLDGIAHMLTKRISDDYQGVEQLGMLATYAHEYVTKKIEILSSELLNAGNLIPIDKRIPIDSLRINPQGGLSASKTPRP